MGTKGCLVLVTRLDFLEPIFLIGEILSNFSISRLNPPSHGGSNDNIIPHAPGIGPYNIRNQDNASL